MAIKKYTDRWFVNHPSGRVLYESREEAEEAFKNDKAATWMRIETVKETENAKD